MSNPTEAEHVANEKVFKGEMPNCLRLSVLVSFSRQLYITQGLLKEPSTAELARSYCSHAFVFDTIVIHHL